MKHGLDYGVQHLGYGKLYLLFSFPLLSSHLKPMRPSDVMLLLPSSMSSVAELEGFVNDIIENNGLSADIQGNLLISLTEAVTNAIRHGNNFDESKYVSIEIWCKKHMLRVLVTDEGEGFMPDRLPDPTSSEFLSVEGGRGVFLMKSLADEIAFHKNGRSVEMCYDCSFSVSSDRVS